MRHAIDLVHRPLLYVSFHFLIVILEVSYHLSDLLIVIVGASSNRMVSLRRTLAPSVELRLGHVNGVNSGVGVVRVFLNHVSGLKKSCH